MRLEFEGVEYTCDTDEITTKQAIVIQGYTGLTLLPWMDAVSKMDAKAVTALAWLAHSQSGKGVPIADLDIRVMAFASAYGDAIQAAKAATAGDAQDPPQAVEEAAEAAVVPVNETLTPPLSEPAT
jgi:hypothetical protein